MSMPEYLLLLEKNTQSYRQASTKLQTPAEIAHWESDLSNDLKEDNAEPEKIEHTYSIYERNQKLVGMLKAHYKGRCQICELENIIETDSGGFYTEGHHLIPLGEKGSDNPTNVVALCLLCHKKLHYSKNRENLKKQLKYSSQHMEILKRFQEFLKGRAD